MDLQIQEIQRGKNLQNESQTIKKMAIGTYISIITLNVNGLSTPTKRHRMDTKTRLIYMLSTRNPLETSRHIQTESEEMENYIPCKWEAKQSWSSNPHIRQDRP